MGIGLRTSNLLNFHLSQANSTLPKMLYCLKIEEGINMLGKLKETC